jgi:diacylglycerol kinase (ATP)
MRICPGARLDDGLLDVTLVLPLPTVRFLRLFPSVYRGEHIHSPSVRTARARSVTLRAPGMTAYADGEPVGSLPVTVEAVPQGLTVLVPPGSAGERPEGFERLGVDG